MNWGRSVFILALVVPVTLLFMAATEPPDWAAAGFAFFFSWMIDLKLGQGGGKA